MGFSFSKEFFFVVRFYKEELKFSPEEDSLEWPDVWLLPSCWRAEICVRIKIC